MAAFPPKAYIRFAQRFALGESLTPVGGGRGRRGGSGSRRVRILDSADGTWHAEAVADQDGIARFDLPQEVEGKELVAVASIGLKQAFAASQGPKPSTAPGAPIFYAYTDRPVYRPDEKVQWKVTLRRIAGRAL